MPRSFWKTVGDVEVEALMITMHHSLAEAEAETPGDTLRDAETLADTLAELKCEKVGETPTDLKAAPPVLTLFPTLAVIKPGSRYTHPA